MERNHAEQITEMESIVHRHFPLSCEMCLPNSTYDFQAEGMPYLGHKQHLDYLNTVLLNNKYGAFLVTGFRGVGKTTLVQSAVKALNIQMQSRVISINVNLSTERAYIDILFEISRKLHDEVKKSDIWYNLSRSERARIELINQRTLMDVKYSQQTSGEIGGSITKANSLKTLSVSVDAKASHSVSEEDTLRNLTVSDIETEFYDIVKNIRKIKPEYKVLIILDEIDKLTQDQKGMECFEDILRQAKGIISGTSSIFIFIAGVDIYEKWEQDNNRIDSLYDSLFSWHLYLPCIWDTADGLFNLFQEKDLVYKPVESEYKKLVKKDTILVLQDHFKILDQYLIFTGKGLPRKILRLFDSFVRRTNGTPYFILTKNNYQKICRISRLYQKFNAYQKETVFQSEMDRDTHYILFLTMLDYLLQIKQEFSKEELFSSLLSENNVGTLRMKIIYEELINAFLTNKIIIERNPGFYAISDLTLQDMQKGITFEGVIPNRIADYSTEDVDRVFRNHLAKTTIPEISQYWGDFQVIKLALLSKEHTILYVIREGVSYIATLYDVQNKRKYNDSAEEKLHLPVERYKSEFMPHLECLVVDNMPFTVIQSPTLGCKLTELVTAELKRRNANIIILQLLSFALEMKKQAILKLPLAPENIMVCHDGRIKILNPIPIFFPSEDKSRYTYSVFRAPESIPDQEGRTIVFSIGMIMLYLLLPYKFDQLMNADTLDTENLIELANCSNRQKRLIGEMVQYDVQKRPILDDKLVKRIRSCSGFLGCRYKPSGNPEDVKFNFFDSNEAYKHADESNIESYDPFETTIPIWEQTIFELLPVKDNAVNNEETVRPTSDLEEADTAKRLDDIAYLENKATNERVEIWKSPFIVGRGRICNYRIMDILASNIHFKIEYKNNHFVLVSMGATNGIMINGEKKKGEGIFPLENNTVIKVGNTELLFKHEPKKISNSFTGLGIEDPDILEW